METLLEKVGPQVPALVVLVWLVVVWIRALQAQRDRFTDTLDKLQTRVEAQQDKAFETVKEIRAGCAKANTNLTTTLTANTEAVRELKTELAFFRAANPQRGGAP